MPTFEAGFNGGRPFKLSLSISLVSQSTANNTSTISWSLNIIKTGTSPSWSNNSSSWNLNINGVTRSGSFTYDFRSADTKNLGSGTQTINHDSDGGRTFGSSASSSADQLGSAGLSGNTTLPTIARASEPSWRSSSTFDAGDTVIIDMNRASTSFTHVVTYNFGGLTGTIDSSADGAATWNVPMSLLTKIPNNTSGTGNVVVKTMSGGSTVGTKSLGFTLRADSSVVPSLSTITVSEANSTVDSLVGAYVQLVTKLALAITGATGIYGSSITGYRITVAGQTINARTGTTSAINASGTVTITGTVTDSRGRSASKSVNINVLPYAAPKLISLSSKRATSGGTIADQGTFIRASINASVSSLAPGGTQKNSLKFRVSTRAKGATTWSPVGPTTTPGGISYNSYQLAPGGGVYAVDTSYDVRIEVIDIFATSTIIQTVPTAVIFMHWDAKIGVGIGKFREQGALDVSGDIYHRNGKLLEPAGMVVPFAGSTAPAGWLVANGAAVSRITYAGLYAVCGTRYGSGDGSTTFNLPDLRTNAVFGYDSGTSGFNTLGSSGGATSHSKDFGNNAWALFDIDAANMYMGLKNVSTGWTATNSGSQAFGGNSAFTSTRALNVQGSTSSQNDMPPYIILLYIIKT